MFECDVDVVLKDDLVPREPLGVDADLGDKDICEECTVWRESEMRVDCDACCCGAKSVGVVAKRRSEFVGPGCCLECDQCARSVVRCVACRQAGWIMKLLQWVWC